jgi:hypothetical protein
MIDYIILYGFHRTVLCINIKNIPECSSSKGEELFEVYLSENIFDMYGK